MKTSGLRGKYSPMQRATDAQRESILALRDELAKDGGTYHMEVRYVAYIGPDTPDAIAVIANGRIYGYVYKDGFVG